MNVFGNYGRAYDLLYADKEYAAEAGYLLNIIKDHSATAKTILDLGCGSGLHAEKFAEAGYQVVGVDQSQTMLELAQMRRSKAGDAIRRRLSFQEGDIRLLDLGRQVDAVSSLFHVMSYMPQNEDLEFRLPLRPPAFEPWRSLHFRLLVRTRCPSLLAEHASESSRK